MQCGNALHDAAASVDPTLIGADRTRFTQVQRVHDMGLTGRGIRVAVVDDAVDFVKTPNWGKCTGIATPADTCRVVAGQNFEEQGQLPVRPPQ